MGRLKYSVLSTQRAKAMTHPGIRRPELTADAGMKLVTASLHRNKNGDLAVT